jgi:hypothetical protein
MLNNKLPAIFITGTKHSPALFGYYQASQERALHHQVISCVADPEWFSFGIKLCEGSVFFIVNYFCQHPGTCYVKLKSRHDRGCQEI